MAATEDNIGCKVYVGSLSYNTTNDSLRELFDKVGPVTEASVIREQNSDKSRGFGFVTFEHPECVQKAINEMNDKELDGRQIKVDRAEKKKGAFGMGRGFRGGRGGGQGRGGGFGGRDGYGDRYNDFHERRDHYGDGYDRGYESGRYRRDDYGGGDYYNRYGRYGEYSGGGFGGGYGSGSGYSGGSYGRSSYDRSYGRYDYGGDRGQYGGSYGRDGYGGSYGREGSYF